MTDIKVTLSGGPAELIERHREWTVGSIGEVAKVSFGAGYEHFSHHGEFATTDSGDQVPVFAWCGRTRVAE
ncbi:MULTISPECIES: DUF5988 family protein [Amycolatopsis]|uniref:Uncharacterized protein n=1 Tax=Amycolatopsis bullii TaxID=941987 RepID=A0ABQ3KM29_9PSEU|nr:DUF5988 family protein [Amycolatopsis bullii]GHG31083.1 hypothetical protein GCM10017567_58910 [Amycolatopsis bullii]